MTAQPFTSIPADVQRFQPIALAAVTSIEAAHPALPGQTKSEMAVNIIMAAAQVGEGVPIPQVQAISGLVADIVGLLNTIGLFSHHAKPAAPKPATPAR